MVTMNHTHVSTTPFGLHTLICSNPDGSICWRGNSLLSLREAHEVLERHFREHHLKPEFTRIGHTFHGKEATHRGMTLAQAVEMSKNGGMKELQNRLDQEQLERESRQPEIPARFRFVRSRNVNGDYRNRNHDTMIENGS